MSELQKMIRRRHLLLGGGTLALSSLCSRMQQNSTLSQLGRVLESEKSWHSNTTDISLRQQAAARGLLYGAVVQHRELVNNLEYASAFARECGILVGRFPWKSIRPTENTFNFQETDYCAEFAAKNQMLFRGYPLIWHRSHPNWLISRFKNLRTKASEVEKIMLGHISTVVGRYAGKVHSWDVVNEVIRTEDERVDGLRDTRRSGIEGERYSTWLHFLGVEYIDLAFRATAAADPEALLVYNENGLSSGSLLSEAKRDAVLSLLERLKSRGTPIHALGLQAHLYGDRTINQESLSKFLRDVASLGLKILITQMDVTDQNLPSRVTARDFLVSKVYENYLSVVLEEPAVIGVITGGLSDRYSWLSSFKPRSDGSSVRPLPLDADLKPKLAWHAMVRAFDNAPKR